MSNLNTEEMAEKICSDPDFIALKRFGHSLKEMMRKYPDGVPSDRLIAQALMITEDQLEEVYQEIVVKLRKSF